MDPIAPGPLVGTMAVAVLIAIVGHMTKARALVALGVMLIVAATLAIMFGAFLSFQETEGPVPDPLRGREVPPEEPVGSRGQ